MTAPCSSSRWLSSSAICYGSDSVRPAADEAGRDGLMCTIGSGNIGATNVLRTGPQGLRGCDASL